MAFEKLDSYVNCPDCGELLQMTLTPYQRDAGVLLDSLAKVMGIGKREHFIAENKCKCGKIVTVSLNVTAEENHG